MDFEALKSVAEAEQNAEKMLSDAALQAKAIVDEAIKTAVSLKDKAAVSAGNDNSEVLKKALADGKAEAEDLLEKEVSEFECIRESSKAKLDDAVKLIIERIEAN